MKLPRAFVTMITLLVLNLILVLILGFTGNYNIAWYFGFLGTMIILVGFLFYIVFWDSKKRWPNDSVFQRYVRVITFRR